MACLMGKQIDERGANILFLMRIVLASVQQLFRRFGRRVILHYAVYANKFYNPMAISQTQSQRQYYH